MSNLNPKQFWYHASKRNLTPGVDQILPANDPRVGGSHYGYSVHDGGSHEWGGENNRGDYTFAADTEVEAENWIPSAWGRPTTYVVSPAEGVETDTEDRFHYDGGEHLKARGPMDIIDRIDIPIPEHGVTQGTLPPVDWGRYDKQYNREANADHRFPVLERMRAENDEVGRAAIESRDRIAYRQQWERAGQQRLFE